MKEEGLLKEKAKQIRSLLRGGGHPKQKQNKTKKQKLPVSTLLVLRLIGRKRVEGGDREKTGYTVTF